MINIEKNIELKNEDIIVVGCSTGPDSMCLMDALLKLREKYQLQLICAHVNHNVRRQSAEEEAFIQEYCIKNQIVLEKMKIEKYSDDNFHNEARNIRYHFFEDVVHKYKADYLVTAHHGDDLIETILMRIVRGSNLQGYSGFHKEIDMGDYKIIRPLIGYSKEDLEAYDSLNNVPYFIDESNHKMKYTRNRYRKNVLPFLKEEDENVHLKFLKFSENLEETSRYISKERDQSLKKILTKQGRINVLDFKRLDRYIQKEILYYILEDFYQDDLVLVNDKHIDLLLYLIYSDKSNLEVNLPNEVLAIKSYDEFYLTREMDEITEYEIEFNTYADLPNKHHIKKMEETEETSNNICRLCSEEIRLPIIIRTRKIGDKIAVKGLNGKKKVKDIFIENKIKIEQRDTWPIVVDSEGKILWIPGLKKSKFDKQKQEKYDIIMKYC
ncbi:MAG: tRNA lysidine(34) synthetase TilS [Bacilli bacterium]|nr:tRNA lysidine(34) synthetase TilS [Bacilli bacterium]